MTVKKKFANDTFFSPCRRHFLHSLRSSGASPCAGPCQVQGDNGAEHRISWPHRMCSEVEASAKQLLRLHCVLGDCGVLPGQNQGRWPKEVSRLRPRGSSPGERGRKALRWEGRQEAGDGVGPAGHTPQPQLQPQSSRKGLGA